MMMLSLAYLGCWFLCFSYLYLIHTNKPVDIQLWDCEFRLIYLIYTVSQKEEATLIFNITSPSVEIFVFTIFEAPCSGLIAGWCNLLYTHHRCEAFT